MSTTDLILKNNRNFKRAEPKLPDTLKKRDLVEDKTVLKFTYLTHLKLYSSNLTLEVTGHASKHTLH